MKPYMLPHRYPFLFIDGVIESEPGKHAAAYKLVSENDWFITDTQTEMPFSLMIEALAQTAAFTGITDENSLGLLSSVKKRKSWARPYRVTGLIYRLKSREIAAGLCLDMPRRQWAGGLLLKLKSASILRNEKTLHNHFCEGFYYFVS